MSIKIVNWKLALVALVFFCLFASLGIWQLLRAQEKNILLQTFQERTNHSPFSAQHLNNAFDWRFYQVKLEGYFDHQHTFLLDNKTHHGTVGYEVYTPFKAIGFDKHILVDRGFVPLGANRNTRPHIPSPNKKIIIIGMLNQPPTYVSLGSIQATKNIEWPLLVEYIALEELSAFSNQSYFPYVLMLSPDNEAALDMEWQVLTTGPERHQGYAVQWFALALTLLVLFAALNRNKNSRGASPTDAKQSANKDSSTRR